MSSFNGCLRALFFLYFFCALTDVSAGLECKSKKLINIFGPKTCPGTFDDPDKSFCCEGDNDLIYCCDFDEFAKVKGAEYLIPVISGIAVGILAGCFLCCLCCPCCMLYKRRHQGTVYGRVQQPTTVTNIQTHMVQPTLLPPQGNTYMPNSMPMPMPMQQATTGGVPMQPQVAPYPGYPPTAEYSGQPQMPPPPYSAVTNEGYAKQAPYNPNF